MCHGGFSPHRLKSLRGDFYVPGGFYAAGIHQQFTQCEAVYDVQPDLSAAPNADRHLAEGWISLRTALQWIWQLPGMLHRGGSLSLFGLLLHPPILSSRVARRSCGLGGPALKRGRAAEVLLGLCRAHSRGEPT